MSRRWEDLVLPVSPPDEQELLVLCDLPYDERGGLLDVYEPPGGSDAVVLVVHGQAEPEVLAGIRSWGQLRSWGRLLAACGFSAVVVGQRSVHGPGGPTAPAEDLAAALAFVGAGEATGTAPRALGLLALSAGVAPALALGSLAPEVRAQVGWYGPLEPLLAPADDDRLHPLRLWAAGRRVPPTLLLAAGADHPSITASIERGRALAAERDLPVEVLTHPDAPHAFDVLLDDEQTVAMVLRTIDHLSQHLLLG